MKIVASILTALLVVILGASTVFYLKAHKPIAEDHARMKAALPAYEEANAELKKLQARHNKETAWMGPAIDVLNTGLVNEIGSGMAEILVTGSKVIVNISDQELYLQGTYTFAKKSPILRLNIAALLKSDQLKGKDIYIGNMTQAVPARGKGRKRVPAKDARTLAAERSAALVKDLEKNDVDKDRLIAAAFSGKQRLTGLKIKEQKTVIIIENPPAVAMDATQRNAVAQIHAELMPDPKITVTAPTIIPASQAGPKPIPIRPAQPTAP